MQVPDWQVSLCVHALPSLHVVPFGLFYVGRARRRRPRARLSLITLIGWRTTSRPRVPSRVLACHVSAVAPIERADVPVVRARRPVRLLPVSRARRRRPRARLHLIALACYRTTGRPSVPCRVLACHVSAVAPIERAGVPVVRARRPVRLLPVSRARRRRPRARLRLIALACYRTTGCPSIPCRVLACHVRSVAPIERADVPVVRTRRPVRLLPVSRARRRRPRARLRLIALACRRTTSRPSVPCRVLARHVRSVAPIKRAGVPVVRARRPVRLLPVSRARRRRPCARLRLITLPSRRTTSRPSVPCRVLAQRAAPVAGVGRTGVAIVRARCPVRLRRARSDEAREIARRTLVGACGVAADAVRAESRRALRVRRASERERRVVRGAQC